MTSIEGLIEQHTDDVCWPLVAGPALRAVLFSMAIASNLQWRGEKTSSAPAPALTGFGPAAARATSPGAMLGRGDRLALVGRTFSAVGPDIDLLGPRRSKLYSREEAACHREQEGSGDPGNSGSVHSRAVSVRKLVPPAKPEASLKPPRRLLQLPSAASLWVCSASSWLSPPESQPKNAVVASALAVSPMPSANELSSAPGAGPSVSSKSSSMLGIGRKAEAVEDMWVTEASGDLSPSVVPVSPGTSYPSSAMAAADPSASPREATFPVQLDAGRSPN
eukprot:CAMPEP_0115757820 /NCGR_PEP_ID=MMETSP0272-20121206/98620_1 /TAXON_ID=71861 /ORGANISM="Scrippsiella trochoidea, Strain CCMP3099" /LENGTH=277 /DNA_ID=CAMNT_0003203345 /DNA_START=297 /DNA_END=1128 /DNA_ORIENTATION=+